MPAITFKMSFLNYSSLKGAFFTLYGIYWQSRRVQNFRQKGFILVISQLSTDGGFTRELDNIYDNWTGFA